MSYQAKIKRYALILEKLDRQKSVSSSGLIGFLSEQGLKVSERQLKRDLESLRYEFCLEINYSVTNRGYALNSDNPVFPYFLKLLEFSHNSELLAAYLKQELAVSEILDFEDFNSFKGMEFMQDLALVIYNQKEIKIRYKRFDSETEKEYEFEPYLLREYMNRWYIVGYLSANQELRTFGLDRMIGYTETGRRFKKAEKQKITSLFKNVVGINASSTDKPETIVLSCQPYLANLLKTLPLHTSQTIISEKATETLISLKVVINYEFRQRLLMLADQSYVVSPPELYAEMKEMLAGALKNYG